MNPAPKWRELHEKGHTHLERAVQPEGECPLCDALIWTPQRERVAVVSKHMHVDDVRSDRSLANRPHEVCDVVYRPPTGKGGKPTSCDHACKRPAGHKSDLHRCPKCDRVWKMPRTALVNVGA